MYASSPFLRSCVVFVVLCIYFKTLAVFLSCTTLTPFSTSFVKFQHVHSVVCHNPLCLCHTLVCCVSVSWTFDKCWFARHALIPVDEFCRIGPPNTMFMARTWYTTPTVTSPVDGIAAFVAPRRYLCNCVTIYYWGTLYTTPPPMMTRRAGLSFGYNGTARAKRRVFVRLHAFAIIMPIYTCM